MLNNLSLGTKFLFVPAVFVIFLFGLAAVHFVNLSHQQEEIQATQRQAIPAYESASTAANRLDQVVEMLNSTTTLAVNVTDSYT